VHEKFRNPQAGRWGWKGSTVHFHRRDGALFDIGQMCPARCGTAELVLYIAKQIFFGHVIRLSRWPAKLRLLPASPAATIAYR
jgi:hypothetical protein